jgi:hypothetical protein
MDLRELAHPGADTWATFLREWRGDDLRGYSEDDVRAAVLPPPLQRYYRVAGRIPTFNLHLVPPAEIEPVDGRMFFIHEEQNVYSFASAPVGDDPPVWLVEDGQYERLSEPLSRFLLQYALFEAIGIEGLHGGWGCVGREDLPFVNALMPELPLTPWRLPAPRTSFHAGACVVGILFDEDGAPSVEVHASARRIEVLAPLRDVVDWDEDPFAGDDPHRRTGR